MVNYTVHPNRLNRSFAIPHYVKTSKLYLLGTSILILEYFGIYPFRTVISYMISCIEQLLVGLVSSYRYEGPKVQEEIVKSEAKILLSAIKNADRKNPIEDEEVVRIVTTRSKPHLKAIFKHCKDINGKNIHEVYIYI